MNATLKFVATQFRVVTRPEEEQDQFEREIVCLLAEGWELAGPMQIAPDTGGRSYQFVQPLVKVEPRVIPLPSPPKSV